MIPKEHPIIEEMNQEYNALWKKKLEAEEALIAMQRLQRLAAWVHYNPARAKELCKDLDSLVMRYIHSN